MFVFEVVGDGVVDVIGVGVVEVELFKDVILMVGLVVVLFKKILLMRDVLI